VINKNESADIDALIKLDEKRRSLIQEVEVLKSKRNTVSELIASLKKNKEDATSHIEEMRIVSDTIKSLDESLRPIEEEMEEMILRIPNMVHVSVPIGKSAAENIEIRRTGDTIEQGFRKNHLEISKQLNILDFERGAKVSGSGFGFYVGKGASLERALINFMIDFHLEKHGYTEMMPPFLANYASMRGTGQLPKMEEDMYAMPLDGLYAIPTAEVPLTNFHRDEVLANDQLPVKYCGYSACFRSRGGKLWEGYQRISQSPSIQQS